MRTITGKDLESWKLAFAKSGIKYETDEEYQEAIYNLVNYLDMLIQMDQQQNTATEFAQVSPAQSDEV